MTSGTPESQAEGKVTRELFAGGCDIPDACDLLLKKFALWKTLTVSAWISHFMCNSHKCMEERTLWLIMTEEIEKHKYFWTVHAQSRRKISQMFEDDRLQLKTQERRHGLLECRGKIQGDYQITFPIHTPTHLQPHTGDAVTSGYALRGSGLMKTKVCECYLMARLR